MRINMPPLKVGCGKFFCEENAIRHLSEEILRLGGRALFIGGPTGLRLVMERVKERLDSADIVYEMVEHTGFCTEGWAKEYAHCAIENDYTVIVGCGGGKCIDVAKCATFFCDLPIITVPTSIATCVATSMLSVMYDDNGHIMENDIYLKKEVDVCIADIDLIATAPPRLLAAGVLDSMAKYPECLHKETAKSYRDCHLTKYLQVVNADSLYQFGMGEGRILYQENGEAERFQEAIINNLLSTSIVSGLAEGSGQLALAHAVYGFMRTNDDKNSLHFLHGEWVAIGLIVQKYFNRDSMEEIEDLKNLMRDMGMPVSLGETDYEVTEESIQALTDDLIEKCGIITEEEKQLVREGVQLIA